MLNLWPVSDSVNLRPNYTYRVLSRATSMGRASNYIYTSKDETSYVKDHEKKVQMIYVHSAAIPFVSLITPTEEESEWISSEWLSGEGSNSAKKIERGSIH